MGPDVASDGSSTAAGTAYRSALFRRFVDAVMRAAAPAGAPAVVDLGPTTPENLLFWTTRGRGLVAVDLLGQQDPCAALARLGDRRFHGILCWNVLGMLHSPVRARIAAMLIERLQPRGALFAVFDGDGRSAPASLRYRIGGPELLSVEPLARANAAAVVSTKEIEEIFAPLAPVRITVMRHGSREVLGVRHDEAPAPR